MAAAPGQASLLFAKLLLLGLALAILAGTAWWWGAPHSDYGSAVGWVMDQPVPFSHEHHVGGLGIDCRFCHASVERSADAGMPPTYTCMTCHSGVWTNAAMLAPVRDGLAAGKPIAWRRINRLPDYVYFNHAIHIAKGIGCASCHGRVDQMPLMHKAKNFTMSFCLDCHRDPAAQMRPRAAIFDTAWRRDVTTPAPAALAAFYQLGGRRLTDCSICHR